MPPRINLKDDVQPLTTFRNNSVKLLQQIRKTKRPLILTLNGRAEVVVQDVAEYERLLDLAAQADFHEGMRQSEEDIRHGRTRPARDVLAEYSRRVKRAG